MTTNFTDEQRTSHAERYLCQQCGTIFRLSNSKLICPVCQSTGRDNIVPVYVESDPDKEQMYTNSDWQAGD